MPSAPAPPAPPHIELDIARDRTPDSRAVGGFVNLRRLDLVATYPSGEKSAPFAYDMCDRAAIDAVVVAAHFVADGVRHVFLRSSVRPPVALREPREAVDEGGLLWEVAAGLIDDGESPERAGARELEEELGLRVRAEDLQLLGPFTYPAPAIIGERHVFFHVEVDPATRSTPSEDGSALERGAEIIAIPLADALAIARAGRLRDAKTELALRRLAEIAA